MDAESLSYLIAHARAEGRAKGLEEAVAALIERAQAARRDAFNYNAREDGGDGSRESCMESAITFFDAVASIRALENLKPPPKPEPPAP